MGCGTGHLYTEKEINDYIKKNQLRLPSAELNADGAIKLTSNDGFFNTSALLDSTWLKGKMTNAEYRESIEHINRRAAQALVQTPANIPISEISKAQATILATQELNEKYKERGIRFKFEKNEQSNLINSTQSFIYIYLK